MAEDLQGLLDKIHAEGIVKAEAEKDAIISAAQEQAEKIIRNAREEADSITAKAHAAAVADQERANAAIRQSARDMTIALKEDLLSKLGAVAKDCAAKAMSPELMSQIIIEMADSYAAGKGGSADIILSRKSGEAAEGILKKALLEKLKSECRISLTRDFGAGLQISFKDNDVFFDFSDEALAEVLCEFVGPKLASVIKKQG